MRRKMMAVCLVAAFALAAVVSASASAARPEFGRCVAKAGGKFLNSGCSKPSVPGKEKFEWEPGVVKGKFTSAIKVSTKATLETVGGTKITCTGETATGEFTNAKEVGKVQPVFTGCETTGVKCSSAGKGEGIISTSPLGGVLGVEKVGTKTPENDKLALELHSEAGNVAEFSCAGIPVVVKGSVLHPATTNKMSLTTTEKFKATKGEQKPDKFAGGPVDQHILESNKAGGAFEEAGQSIESVTTGEEKIEASTVN
jgi:hypothetical protein